MTSEATAGQVPDIYGQVHPVETPELIEKKLKEFDELVEERVKDKNKKDTACLEQAMEKCPEILSHGFKLMFLRSEVFQTDLAVARYTKYWTKRVFLFKEKAFLKLTLENCLSEDKIALERGLVRVVPGATDSMGRSILLGDSSRQDFSLYSHESMMRALWYVFHAALETEAAQKHGMILIGDPSKATIRNFDRRFSRLGAECTQGIIPGRVAAMHICKPPVVVSLVAPFIKAFLADRLKKRLLFHPGKKNEKVLRALEKYGLKKELLPDQIGGDVKLDHLCWLQQRRKKGL